MTKTWNTKNIDQKKKKKVRFMIDAFTVIHQRKNDVLKMKMYIC